MTAKPDLAQALLDAHVAYLVETLGGPGLAARVEAEIAALFADAARLKLKDVVTPAMIKRTAHRYASEIEFGGGLPELVAATAQALYAHPVHARTQLQDLVSTARYTEVVDKLLELRGLREKLIRAAAASPVYAAFASDLLYHGIRDYIARSAGLTRGIPGAASVMKLGRSVVSKASPRLEASVEEGLKSYVARSIEATARGGADFILKHLDEDALRAMALEVWSRIRTLPVAQLREDIGSDDVEDFFVIGYEYWRELRKTRFYRELIDAGIDAFFAAYGSTPLSGLLADLGITEQIAVEEALHFAPHVIKALRRKKLLEPMLRRQLEGFYASPACAALLGAAGGKAGAARGG